MSFAEDRALCLQEGRRLKGQTRIHTTSSFSPVGLTSAGELLLRRGFCGGTGCNWVHGKSLGVEWGMHAVFDR